MTIEDFVTHEINEYQTDNVREIIDYHDISIEYNDQLNKACDSSIFLTAVSAEQQTGKGIF